MIGLATRGYFVAPHALDGETCDALTRALPHADARRGGVRNLLRHDAVLAALRDEGVRGAIREVLPGDDVVAVKATLFDKTNAANWRVQWHQDRFIAVRERRDGLPRYRGWSVKDGVPHVEPPEDVLASMLALRIHLDDCGLANGPLRVIAGSHARGRIDESEIASVVAAAEPETLAVPRGTLLFMRPLLLHASSPATEAAHRRVLHIELASRDAIAPLAWHDAVAVT